MLLNQHQAATKTTAPAGSILQFVQCFLLRNNGPSLKKIILAVVVTRLENFYLLLE
jgi:hypothetical protein